jgi:hypothetical protein
MFFLHGADDMSGTEHYAFGRLRAARRGQATNMKIAA